MSPQNQGGGASSDAPQAFTDTIALHYVELYCGARGLKTSTTQGGLAHGEATGTQ